MKVRPLFVVSVLLSALGLLFTGLAVVAVVAREPTSVGICLVAGPLVVAMVQRSLRKENLRPSDRWVTVVVAAVCASAGLALLPYVLDSVGEDTRAPYEPVGSSIE